MPAHRKIAAPQGFVATVQEMAMPMSPEESALLVKLQVMKAERDRYREALERIAAIYQHEHICQIAKDALKG